LKKIKSEAQAAADALNASLRALAGPRLEAAHPAQQQLTALWGSLAPSAVSAPEVAEWTERAFYGILEPLIALMVECQTANKLPARAHVDALRITENALRRRFSKAGARKFVVYLFERYCSVGYVGIDAGQFAGMIAVALEHAFDCEVTVERLERIKVAVEAMAEVRGRSRKKDTLKWPAIANVLAAYGDPVNADSLRRTASKKPARRKSHVLKKGEI
jgi:hypothetical protein